MKKKLSLLLAVLLIIACAACGDGSSSSSGSSTVESSSADKSSSTPVSSGTDESSDVSTASTGSGEPQYGGTLIASIPGDPTSFNPCAFSDDYGMNIFSNVFSQLVTITRDMDVVGDLATDWEYNDAGDELTFYLRDDVDWHDGEHFTAKDVVYTFTAILENSGVASSNLSNIESVEAIDDYTVVFKLSQTDASIIGKIAWYGTSIMPAHIYDVEGIDWTENDACWKPIGTGPFKFVEYTAGVSVKLEANENFYGDGPYVDELVFQIITDAETEYQAWKNGEIDIMYQNPKGTEYSLYEDNEDYNSRFSMFANRTYFTFNLVEGRFADVRLREAFNLALDREEIYVVGLKGAGAVAEYYISPLFAWALNENAKIPERDVDRAKELIEEAGYEADADGIYLEVTIDVFAGFEDTLTVAQQNLLDAGIKLNLNTLEYSAWVEKVKEGRDFEVTMLAGYQGPDISNIQHRVYSTGGNNIAGYSNSEADELMSEANKYFTNEERVDYYLRLQEILAEDLPLVLCNENGSLAVVRSDVHGVPMIDEDAAATTRTGRYSKVWFEQ